MPLYITPYQKLSVTDVMHLMTSHYEGTEMDSSVDVGSGLFESPYRPRPLVWEYNDLTYHNERSIATPKTGWSFVGQIRPSMPAELAALLWFAVDDSSTAPRVPIYSSSTKIAEPYAGKGAQDGVVTPLMKFDMNKAFWVQNMVSNFCYYRWRDVYPIVRRKIDGIQRNFEQKIKVLDTQAMKVYKEAGAKEAVELVTRFGVEVGSILHEDWVLFYGELFVQFRDFYTITKKANEPVCGCQAKEPGLSDAVKKRIVEETGEHYRVEEKEGVIPVLHGESGNHHLKIEQEMLPATQTSSLRS
jgi:dipeptidase